MALRGTSQNVWVVHKAVCSHYMQPSVLSIKRMEGRVVELDATQVLTSATSVALLIEKCEHVVVFLGRALRHSWSEST